MILIDTNIIMYAAGAAHSHKAASVLLLHRVASDEVDAIIDAETLQEILHRYRAIGRWDDGKLVYDFARQIFPHVISIASETLDHARRLMDTSSKMTARDALHAAVVLDERIEAICSYDRDFDAIAGIKRVEPPEL